MNKKVSCIMPIYNAEKYLEAAIDSVLEQTYQNIELILVNDASNDKTDSICAYYSAAYPTRVNYIKREINGGSSAAAQDGVAYAKGEYLAFLDSDDLFTKNRIELGVKDLDENQDIDITICDYTTIDSEGTITGRRTSVPDDMDHQNVLNYELKRNYIVRGLLMLRNTKDAVYDVRLRNSDDYDFFLNLIYRGHRVLFTKDVGMLYRVHQGNKSSQYGKAAEATKYILSKYAFDDLHKQLKKNGIGEQQISITFGVVSLLKEEYSQAISYFEKAISESIHDPNDLFETYFYMAAAHYKIGEYENARKSLEKLEAFSEPSVYNNLGVLHAMEKNNETAKELFQKALTLQPLYIDANHNLEQVMNGGLSDRYTERILRKNLVHVQNK